MNGLALLVCLTLGQSPAIEVVTLSERQIQGTLESFTAETVAVKTSAESISVPIAEVLMIRSTTAATAATGESKLVVRLVDGSRLHAQSFISTGNAATLRHMQLGELKLSNASIFSVRLAEADSRIDHEWDQLLERSAKKDMAVIRKGDVLDHLDGVIGSLNETTLQFQLDGDDIPVKREKVFGLIYSKRESSAKKAVAQLELTSGDRLAMKQIAWNGSNWKVRLVSGLEMDVSAEHLPQLITVPANSLICPSSNHETSNIRRSTIILAHMSGNTGATKTLTVSRSEWGKKAMTRDWQSIREPN